MGRKHATKSVKKMDRPNNTIDHPYLTLAWIGSAGFSLNRLASLGSTKSLCHQERVKERRKEKKKEL